MTVLELLIAMGIAAIISTAAYQLMTRGQLIEKRITQETAAVHAVRMQVRRMTNEVQEGTRIVHPLPGSVPGVSALAVSHDGTKVLGTRHVPRPGEQGFVGSIGLDCTIDLATARVSELRLATPQ